MKQRRSKSQKKTSADVTALSFFSGAMGLDIGLEKAGFEVLLACENDTACQKTILANKPATPLIGDIWDYSPKEILAKAGLSKKSDLDIVVGGPPCQAFSTAGGRKGFKDARGNALLRYLEIIFELMPKYAVIENVRGLLSAPLVHTPHSERGAEPLSQEELPGGALLYVLSLLRKAGYAVSFNLYNSANYGSPQIRERVVLLCSRDGTKIPYLTPTHSENGAFNLPKWRTFRDAVAGLSSKKHTHVDFPENRLRFYRMLKAGQYWKHLPVALQKEALGKSYYSGGGKTGFLRRLAWDKPSPTLVTHPAMPATDLAHPEADRPLSIEEYKRVQEFPDDWAICGSLIDQYRQIGNAVPISLGYAIGTEILAHLDGKREHAFPDFNYSRYKGTDEVTWENRVSSEINAKTLQKIEKQLALFAA